MATVVAAPRAAASGPRQPVAGAPRRTLDTPTLLTGLLTLVAILCVLAGTLGAVVSARSATAARALAAATVPAEVDASTIYTKVADADATAATAFLAGGLEPADLRAAYLDDIAKTGAAIADVGAPPAGTAAATALADLTSRLPVYTGLIETARANNRQGFPVGGAYLSTASSIAQTTLLGDAKMLLDYEQARVASGYSDARSGGTTALLFLALLVLGIVLVLGQLALARRTRRVLNLALALATVFTLVALIAATSVIGVARSRLDAGATASSQIALLTAAQIAALQEKGAGSLTLVGRGDDSHESQFRAAANALDGPGGLLARAAANAPSDADKNLLSDAGELQMYYLSYVDQVSSATGNGDLDASSEAQADAALPFGTLISQLKAVSDDDRSIFAAKVGSTTHPLDLLAVGIPVLAGLALLLSAIGIRLRLREFR